MSQCQCQPDSFPFQCPRHGCRKTRHWWKLCQTRADYFRLWEEGRGPGQQRPIREPGLLRKALNFGRALWRHWRNRRLRVSRRAYRQRLAVCEGCPSLDAERMVCRERKCGCKVERKAGWASEHCPLGKWPGDSSDTANQSNVQTEQTRRVADAATGAAAVG